jgi:UDP-N-acetylglucosamine acyltransferase
MAREIHPTALVGVAAEIGDDVVIGPFCIVGDAVKVRSGVRLVSNVIVEGLTTIGEGTVIHPFTTIGLPPQDTKYTGEPTGVIIGRNNTIREYNSIHRGSVGGDGFTTIGDNNFILAYSHIAHDCKVGSSNIMVNAATLAGHVVMEDFITLGGIVAVHGRRSERRFTGHSALYAGIGRAGQIVWPECHRTQAPGLFG